MSEDIETTSGYELFLWLDVGKDTHHADAMLSRHPLALLPETLLDEHVSRG